MPHCASVEIMRKDPLEILERIFQELEKGKPFSLNELSQRTKLHHVTVRRYVKVIEMVRGEPEVEVIKTRHSIIVRVKR
ncbi:MAG: HTH domain-containing protein [Candidatus Aenigmarchaeota archaeon]|nr:HTH domain-containing protein [Candidatus Aenigmarchaeota archaeon]